MTDSSIEVAQSDAAPAFAYVAPASRGVVGRRQGVSRARHTYAAYAPFVAAGLLITISARVQELVPALRYLRPSLTFAVLGGGSLLFASSGSVLRGAFKTPLLRLLLAYAGWALVTAPFGLWAGQAMSASVSQFPPAVALVLTMLLCAPTLVNLERITLAFVMAVGVHAGALLAFANYFASYDGDRLSGTGGLDPNDVASLMAMTVPIALGFVLRRRGVVRYAAAGVAAVCVLTLMKTASRGGTLALGMGAVVFILGLRGWRRAVLLTALPVAAALALTVGPQEFRDRTMSMFTLEKDYNYTDFYGRKAVWARARGYIVEHPVTGVGMGNFPIAEGQTLSEKGIHGKWSNTHNAYLQAYAELGVLGGTLFLALLVTMGRAALPLWRGVPAPVEGGVFRRPELLASLAAFCTGAYFLSHAYFWAMFGLIGVIALGYRVTFGDLPLGRAAHMSGSVPTSSPQARQRRVGGLRRAS